MTTNRHDPAQPFACQGPTTAPEFYYGLTKYEHAVIQIAAGLAANPALLNPAEFDGRNVGTNMAFNADMIATAIFDRLEKGQQ